MKHCVFCIVGFALMLALTLPAVAQNYEGVAVKSGQAAFRFAGKDLTFTYVEGSFQQVQGFTLATLVYRPAAKTKVNTHLNLTLMYNAPGKVDLEGRFSMSGIGMFSDGDVSGYTKGKSNCTITITKGTATEVEGTAECPLLHNIEGKVMPPLTGLNFSAAVK
jgi:hypothetical protein